MLDPPTPLIHKYTQFSQVMVVVVVVWAQPSRCRIHHPRLDWRGLTTVHLVLHPSHQGEVVRIYVNGANPQQRRHLGVPIIMGKHTTPGMLLFC